MLNRARDDGTDPQRAAEIRFMRFFHHTPMAIATIDKHGGVVRTNPLFARLFHGRAAAGRANDRSILVVVAERDRDALQAAIAQAALGKGDIAPVDAMLAGDGERFGRFYVTAVEEEERDQEAAIVYALETTAQRELENKVTQQQKMELVGQLAGGIAHDFNNVLSAIMMATDFLLNAHRPTDPSFQDIMQIKQNANRAASLVRHLLAFSRKQTMRPQVLDLGEVLSDLTMLLRRLIGEKVTLDVVHGRDLWPVKVDISQFEQVIVNLAVNARDAMPDGGRLHVAHHQRHRAGKRALPRQGHAGRRLCAGRGRRYRHRHSGEDRRQDFRAVLFDQGGRQRHRSRSLHGLRHHQADRRLRLCRFRRAEGHHLPHFPAAPHRDARRRSRRNASEAEASALAGALAAAEPGKRAASADLTGEGTILLVEDEEGLRQLNARGLTSRGYTVLEAGNGVEAIEVLEKSDGKVDLVVSDVVMPEMDGPTLLARTAQPQSQPEDHLRLRLCRGCVPKASAGRRPICLPGKAFHAQATGQCGERDAGGLICRETRHVSSGSRSGRRELPARNIAGPAPGSARMRCVCDIARATLCADLLLRSSG